ncbi:flavin reductase family protein [Azospirillum sp.]|uniref:flavin reductase family protein n=1 Tax=Azospirillum sp. TaxID=34012 RepID=UPI002D5B40CF|nr:flavin reductase family protein [Azospirillum sp.]HYD71110.1 flavin reductase family protein [Azospirillum sp.]HYH23184.1 flavin reductase family protein [Azospirillum sp.]
MTAFPLTAAPAASDPAVSSERFLAGMRLFAAGCTIIAARHGGVRAGLTATALCSVTADPPRLLVCVNQKVRAHTLIAASEALSVNVLAHGQEAVARRFAGMVEGVAGEDRFQGADWVERVTGAPVLKDALVGFDCRVAETIDAGTHSVFLCRVVDVQVAAAPVAPDPLLYFDGHFAKLA